MNSEFTLQETMVSMCHATEAIELLMEVDCGDATKMHGSLFAIKCILDRAIYQINSLPTEWLEAEQQTGRRPSI